MRDWVSERHLCFCTFRHPRVTDRSWREDDLRKVSVWSPLVLSVGEMDMREEESPFSKSCFFVTFYRFYCAFRFKESGTLKKRRISQEKKGLICGWAKLGQEEWARGNQRIKRWTERCASDWQRLKILAVNFIGHCTLHYHHSLAKKKKEKNITDISVVSFSVSFSRYYYY